MALGTTAATFVYFQQAHIVRRAYPDLGTRTAIFALMDLAVNALTIVTQLFVTGRVMARLGLSPALAFQPALVGAGFAALAVAPIAPVVMVFQIARRGAQYALTGPARETLFTVVSRAEKYTAKNVIDTVVYRGGDAVSGWAFAGLAALGLGMSGVALVTLPLAALWLATAIYLGRRHAQSFGSEGRPG
jgi:AAA family ATP:ADP antiporter